MLDKDKTYLKKYVSLAWGDTMVDTQMGNHYYIVVQYPT